MIVDIISNSHHCHLERSASEVERSYGTREIGVIDNFLRSLEKLEMTNQWYEK